MAGPDRAAVVGSDRGTGGGLLLQPAHLWPRTYARNLPETVLATAAWYHATGHAAPLSAAAALAFRYCICTRLDLNEALCRPVLEDAERALSEQAPSDAGDPRVRLLAATGFDALLPLTVPHLFCAKGGEVPTWAWDLVEDCRQHPDPLVSALALIADGRAMAVEPALRDALLCLGRSQVRARIIAALPPSACDQERALSLLQDGDPEVCSALLGHLGSCSDQDWARDAILPLIHCGSSYFSQDVRREALVLALGHDLPGAPAWARGLVQSGSRSRAAAEARSWCVEQITVTDALLLDIGGIDSDDDGNPFESLHDLRSGCRMNVPARMRQLADTLEADADEQTVAAHAGRRLVISIDDWEPRHEDGAVHGTLLRQLLTSCDVVFCAADGHHLVAEVQPGLRDAPLLAALFEAATCVLLRARWF